MPAFIALLRGVNVGKAKRVPMADFRRLLERLGYGGVVTLLNSGNAVFRVARGTPSKLAADITTALRHQLKVEVPVIVKSAREFGAIVEACPIDAPEAEHSRLLVTFVQRPKMLESLQGVAALVKSPEWFFIGEQAAYLHCARGILQSKAAGALLGKAGRAATTRNWATVMKLNAAACPDN
jgi:uncharacterized protein (DUF1697 family)